MKSFELPSGFLPQDDPLKHLGSSFSDWEAFASQLHKWLMSNQLREAVVSLPSFDVTQCRLAAEVERAMALMSFIGHAYVWCYPPYPKVLPKAIALPWHALATQLHRPPVLSYASYALHNWFRFDRSKPIALGNIALIQNFLGGKDEEWFILVHVDIEAKATDLLQQINTIFSSLSKDDTSSVTSTLKEMAVTLTALCDTLDRMPEQCDPYIYYQRVRPYIHGWKNNPALPDGLIYEGVDAYQGKPQVFRGETGAQSAIVPMLDGFFGITHKNDVLGEYLKEMRDYMPKAHRQVIEMVEEHSTLRAFVEKHKSHHAEMKDYYNACIECIARFRRTHLEYAIKYIHKQGETSSSNSTSIGTGGTPFVEYLKKHFSETSQFMLA